MTARNSGTTISNFEHFASLPRELRIQIWQYTLPKNLNQSLLCYKRGCWRHRYIQKGDADYTYEPDFEPPGGDELNLEFRHDLLDPLSYSNTLLHTNHEARSVALSWLNKHEDCRLDPARGAFSFSFSSTKLCHCTLYLEQDQVDDFVVEALLRGFDNDLAYRHLSPVNTISRLALPLSRLAEGIVLDELFHHCTNIKILYIVVGEQPTYYAHKDGVWESIVQPRWEIEVTGQQPWLWNAEKNGWDYPHLDQGCGGEAFDLVNSMLNNFRRTTIQASRIIGFDIRIASAIRM